MPRIIGQLPEKNNNEVVEDLSRQSAGVKLSRKPESRVKATKPAGTWIRPLGLMESYWAIAAKYVCANTVQAVWLSSTQPLQASMVAQAVHQVTSQVEVLQTCIAKRHRLQLWFRKLDDYKPDFVVSYDDPLTLFDNLLNTPFNLKQGPLWKARFAPSPNNTNEAVLLLAIHHSITDGTTNLILVRDILRCINAFCKNEEVALDYKPIAPPMVDDLLKLSHVPYIVTHGIKNVFETLVKSRLHSTPTSVLQGNPGEKVARTRVIAHEFSVEETSKFFKECKEAKVTVNCCVAAAARLAMFKLVQHYRPGCKKAIINVENLVNARRYLSNDQADVMGNYISSEGQQISISQTDFEDFWNLARRVHNKQSKHLNTDVPVKRLPLYHLGPLAYLINATLTKRGSRNVDVCHVAITNMGNLDKYLPTDIETHVKVTDYVRSVSDPNGPSMCILTCHTLRGRFMLSLDQATNRLNDQMADYYFTTLVSYLQSIAAHGDICV